LFENKTKSWWLVHTKSRNEKALAGDLNRLGISHFLPLATVDRSYSGRREKIRIPLFPGYLFMNGDAEERHRTLATNRVASVISVADQERLEEDLEQIRRLVDSEQPVDVWPGIRVGRRCCVISGPLKGLEGVVLRRRGTCRVHLAVHVLGQGAEVEIDASCLELTGENDSSVCHQMEARVQTS
jgi:transcription antitermination factor NusG